MKDSRSTRKQLRLGRPSAFLQSRVLLAGSRMRVRWYCAKSLGSIQCTPGPVSKKVSRGKRPTVCPLTLTVEAAEPSSNTIPASSWIKAFSAEAHLLAAHDKHAHWRSLSLGENMLYSFQTAHPR